MARMARESECDAGPVGAVAQLGERLVRNEEVSGSIPLSSTKQPLFIPVPIYFSSHICPRFSHDSIHDLSNCFFLILHPLCGLLKTPPAFRILVQVLKLNGVIPQASSMPQPADQDAGTF